ncbi:hypothetical protein Gpo141_00014323 [Globisporangium polare]
MVKFVSPATLALAGFFAASVSALSVPTSKWPASTGTMKFDAPRVIKAGEVFDGKMMTYELSNVVCQGQTESSKDTMVFLVEAGGTLKNAIIGKNQMEGVHCDKHDCTIENVWWDDVCEDALSIKGGSASSVSKVLGGGARYADDKVVQHNGGGKVTIDGFYAEDFGKLYRSCGTCGDVKRQVEISNVLAVNPKVAVAAVNKNYGDEAKFSNIHIQTTTKKKVVVCAWSQGVAKGEGEPGKLGDGPSPPLCQYSDSDIIMNGAAGTGGGSDSPSSPVVTTPSPAASDDGGDDETMAPKATPAPATADDADAETKAPAASDSDDGETDDAPAATTSTPKTKSPKTPKASKTPKPSKAPKTPKPSKTPKATEAATTDDAN